MILISFLVLCFFPFRKNLVFSSCSEGILGEGNFEEFCYNLFTLPSVKKSFTESENACLDWNGDAHLLSIHSVEEDDFAFNKFQEQSSLPYYIGLTGSTDVEWTDQTPVDFLKTISGGTSKECVSVTTSNEWKRVPCTSALNYVCKYNMTVQNMTTNTNTTENGDNNDNDDVDDNIDSGFLGLGLGLEGDIFVLFSSFGGFFFIFLLAFFALFLCGVLFVFCGGFVVVTQGAKRYISISSSSASKKRNSSTIVSLSPSLTKGMDNFSFFNNIVNKRNRVVPNSPPEKKEFIIVCVKITNFNKTSYDEDEEARQQRRQQRRQRRQQERREQKKYNNNVRNGANLNSTRSSVSSTSSSTSSSSSYDELIMEAKRKYNGVLKKCVHRYHGIHLNDQQQRNEEEEEDDFSLIEILQFFTFSDALNFILTLQNELHYKVHWNPILLNNHENFSTIFSSDTQKKRGDEQRIVTRKVIMYKGFRLSFSIHCNSRESVKNVIYKSLKLLKICRIGCIYSLDSCFLQHLKDNPIFTQHFCYYGPKVLSSFEHFNDGEDNILIAEEEEDEDPLPHRYGKDDVNSEFDDSDGSSSTITKEESEEFVYCLLPKRYKNRNSFGIVAELNEHDFTFCSDFNLLRHLKVKTKRKKKKEQRQQSKDRKDSISSLSSSTPSSPSEDSISSIDSTSSTDSVSKYILTSPSSCSSMDFFPYYSDSDISNDESSHHSEYSDSSSPSIIQPEKLEQEGLRIITQFNKKNKEKERKKEPKIKEHFIIYKPPKEMAQEIDEDREEIIDLGMIPVISLTRTKLNEKEEEERKRMMEPPMENGGMKRKRRKSLRLQKLKSLKKHEHKSKWKEERQRVRMKKSGKFRRSRSSGRYRREERGRRRYTQRSSSYDTYSRGHSRKRKEEQQCVVFFQKMKKWDTFF